jgi:hypothetical protein
VAQSRAASRRKSRSDPEPDQGDTGIRQTGLGPRQAVQVGPALGVLATDHRRIHRVPALLQRLAGIQQCCAHVIRRCRAVTKPGPGGLQSWAGDIIAILREAHRAAGNARARGGTGIDPQMLAGLLERYDQAVRTGITHNRLRDWHNGNHPGYWHSLATSPAGAESAATSTPPPPTESPRSTPSATPSRESPGYRHSPLQHDTNSRTP